MFGLVGSGRTEVAKAIFGARPADAGAVRLDGRRCRLRHARPRRCASGIAMLTEDRKGDGLALDLSVLDNAGLPSLPALRPARRHRPPAPRALVGAKIGELSVRPRDTAPAGAPALRRQPAEGRARQVAAGRGHRALHLRRADPRRRHRHQGRDLPDDPRPRDGRRGGAADLLGDAGGARPGRPPAGHARRAGSSPSSPATQVRRRTVFAHAAGLRPAAAGGSAVH